MPGVVVDRGGALNELLGGVVLPQVQARLARVEHQTPLGPQTGRVALGEHVTPSARLARLHPGLHTEIAALHQTQIRGEHRRIAGAAERSRRVSFDRAPHTHADRAVVVPVVAVTRGVHRRPSAGGLPQAPIRQRLVGQHQIRVTRRTATGDGGGVGDHRARRFAAPGGVVDGDWAAPAVIGGAGPVVVVAALGHHPPGRVIHPLAGDGALAARPVGVGAGAQLRRTRLVGGVSLGCAGVVPGLAVPVVGVGHLGVGPRRQRARQHAPVALTGSLVGEALRQVLTAGVGGRRGRHAGGGVLIAHGGDLTVGTRLGRGDPHLGAQSRARHHHRRS
ncbi:MAG: hypothetical protein JJLCMIEE_01066 [Acidimicrobiales bacterium]|nr:hypothetical protein [Acidimicrobiales bacterium]